MSHPSGLTPPLAESPSGSPLPDPPNQPPPLLPSHPSRPSPSEQQLPCLRLDSPVVGQSNQQMSAPRALIPFPPASVALARCPLSPGAQPPRCRPATSPPRPELARIRPSPRPPRQILPSSPRPRRLRVLHRRVKSLAPCFILASRPASASCVR